MSLLSELNRRNVFRVGAAYAVTAWLLIQVAETIFPLFGFDETPARIVVVVLAIGFIPALVLAWAFEITPEGLRREKETASPDLQVPAAAGKKFDRAIALVLALALGYFAFDKFVLEPAREVALVEETVQQARSDALVESYGEKSIAVLPFENLSNDPEQEYFSDGIAEELLNLLSRVPRLRVISRSSSFAFKGQAINIPTVARQLGVNHVLEGSVRRIGDRVRITAQLIDARSDTQMWSRTFERTLDDVFAIQDEISAAIVRELGSELALDVGESAEVRAPASAEAYEAYLRGRYLMAKRGSGPLKAAVVEFENALAIDPDYALAHASLAIALALRQDSLDLTRAEVIERGRPHADRALELNPNLAEAHAALGWMTWAPDTLDEAEAHFRRAIELNPGYADAQMWVGHFALNRGNYTESLARYQEAARLDPLSVPAKNNLIAALKWRGRIGEARQLADTLASLWPEFRRDWLPDLQWTGGNWADGALTMLEESRSGAGLVYGNLRLMLALMGMKRAALPSVAAAESDGIARAELHEDTPDVFALLGRPAEALAALQQLPSGIPQQLGPGYVQAGLLYAASGDVDRAGLVLEQFWEARAHTAGVGLPSTDANFVLALMSVRRQRGDEAGVAELELALQDAIRRYDAAGIVLCDPFEGCVDFDRGVSLYLSGNRKEGMALIARSIETGYFIPPNHAHLRLLYDDPDFAIVVERQQAHQARQREKFLAVICAGNPYADVWQPPAGTCDGFDED